MEVTNWISTHEFLEEESYKKSKFLECRQQDLKVLNSTIPRITAPLQKPVRNTVVDVCLRKAKSILHDCNGKDNAIDMDFGRNHRIHSSIKQCLEYTKYRNAYKILLGKLNSTVHLYVRHEDYMKKNIEDATEAARVYCNVPTFMALEEMIIDITKKMNDINSTRTLLATQAEIINYLIPAVFEAQATCYSLIENC